MPSSPNTATSPSYAPAAFPGVDGPPLRRPYRCHGAAPPTAVPRRGRRHTRHHTGLPALSSGTPPTRRRRGLPT
jgi:hypothetical protein